MAKISVLGAAAIIQNTYAGKNQNEVIDKFDVGGAQAVLLDVGGHRVLSIPGTNERSDWAKFNFDVLKGDSSSVWHAGFLKHAQIIYTFAKMGRPDFIVGHSLGAASAQIVGMSMQRPTVAFASPRPLRGKLKSSHGKWVLNVNRLDDVVCNVPPPMMGFRHIGKTVWLMPDKINVGEDHRIDKYIDLIMRGGQPRKLPKNWPSK